MNRLTRATTAILLSAGLSTGLSSPVAAAPAAVVDFNGDGFTDLALGVPGEDSSGQADAGRVNIVYGSAGGLTGVGNQALDQSVLVGTLEAGDRFGSALTTGDFNGDGFTDLAVGVPGEDSSGQADAGRVNIVYGSAGGLSTVGNQALDQSILAGTLEAGDGFGSALAAGNFG